MFIYKLPIARDYCFDNYKLPKCCPCASKRCTGRLSDGGRALSEIPGDYGLTRTHFLPCVSSASLTAVAYTVTLKTASNESPVR